MRIIAIDPGPEQSAWVLYDSVKKEIINSAIEPNPVIVAPGNDLLSVGHQLVVEVMVSAFINPTKKKGYVGKTTMATQKWAGIFLGFSAGRKFPVRHYDFANAELHRKQVVSHLCGNARAGDSDIRAVLMDSFPATGKDSKGKPSVMGTKKRPGPLYGIKKDLWSALALAVTYADKLEKSL